MDGWGFGAGLFLKASGGDEWDLESWRPAYSGYTSDFTWGRCNWNTRRWHLEVAVCVVDRCESLLWP
jgi:hypothetical protein